MQQVALLRVEHLVKEYRNRRQVVRAVDDVSFDIAPGETLALVGESGSGKTTTALCALQLDAATSGTVSFDGVDLASATPAQRKSLRRATQFIFQDPTSSLNPRLRVGAIIREPLDIHAVGTPAERNLKVRELLIRVGLPADAAERRPREFSGGQRQRIGIARALALDPRLVVCDEPVSALDVSVQAQVVNLLRELQSELGIAYLFIAHDLAVVSHLADRVAVMYLGTIVETGTRTQVFGAPRHPYTVALLSASPSPDPDRPDRRIVLAGEPPSPFSRQPGCPFAGRCWRTDDRCRTERPPLVFDDEGHGTACHYPLPDRGGHP